MRTARKTTPGASSKTISRATDGNDSGNAPLLKHVLKNALDFGGKANSKVVLGLVLKERPELRKKVPEVLAEITVLAGEVEKETEKHGLGYLRQKLQEIAPELLTLYPGAGTEKGAKWKAGGDQARVDGKVEGKGREMKQLKPLPNARDGQVIVRIAPSPSGALHVGHAYGACLNALYAEKYRGKLLLRIEDTNPENIYPPAYELIPDDIRWLGGQVLQGTVIQSSRLGIYYDHAEKLLQQGHAYVCTCDADEWRKLKAQGLACPCRSLDRKEQLLRYAAMFSRYAEGEAVLRMKADIKDRNPAMRDFALMRIVEHVHPKTGKAQRVWPLMVFAVAVDDQELGVTHVLNGKDHADNAAKERRIMECLGWKPPEYLHWGRINFIGLRLSSSETRHAIEQGQYLGWDDIRLPFLPALRRRGYQPGAFRQFALEIGLSANDKSVQQEEFWKMINAFNRDIIEPQAERYFFADNPVEIRLKGLASRKVELLLHPDHPEKGKRLLSAGERLFISGEDLKRLGEGYLHRLMDCCNFEVAGSGFVFREGSYDDYRKSPQRGHIIHWVPAAEAVAAEILLENGSLLQGVAEKNIEKLPLRATIQFERRFFATLDKKEKNKYTFWYLHR